MGRVMGALSRSIRRPRYAPGGTVRAPASMDLARPLPDPLGEFGGPPEGALSTAAPMSTSDTVQTMDSARQKLAQANAATKILKAAGAEVPSVVDPNNPNAPVNAVPPVPSAPPPQGALATGVTPADTADAQSITSTLHHFGQGPIQTDMSQAPGAVNLPMLAAAGAMLKPTHSGSFSEALGNAFDASVPVAEKQRALAESSLLRKAQQDQTAAYWGAKSDTADKNADTAAKRQIASQVYLESKAKYVALGYDEKVAHDRATEDVAKTLAGIRQQSVTTAATKVANQDSQFQQAEARRVQTAHDSVDFKNADLALRAAIASGKMSQGDYDMARKDADAQIAQGTKATDAWKTALANRGLARSLLGMEASPAAITAPTVGGNSASSPLPLPKEEKQMLPNHWYTVGGASHKWTGSGFE